jgi:transcriptional regulator with XRE-family HTH domain
MTIISNGPIIGPILRDMRFAAGITQQELENRTGVALSQISTYETSRRVPDLDVAARLATGLNHRICILPVGHAIGQQQRQAVIDAAKYIVENETEPFADRLANLHAAVDALPGSTNLPSDNPYAEIRELRERLELAKATVQRLRTSLSRLQDAAEAALR